MFYPEVWWGKMRAAYYLASVPEFLLADAEKILGQLTLAHGFTLEQLQRDAWATQIEVLNADLYGIDCGHILFEFVIPRMGKRADVVLVFEELVFVLEYKAGTNAFDRAAIDQVHDYALDLKNFHKGSHDTPIVPIVVATGAEGASQQDLCWAVDGVAQPLLVGSAGVRPIIDRCLEGGFTKSISFEEWLAAGYQPTPTIVEAAQALYQSHDVVEIARSDAGAKCLTSAPLGQTEGFS
jgi:hypothetical protein